MEIKKIVSTQFNQEVLANSQLTIVDFYADWCGPCKRLLPELEAVADELAGKVTIVKVNVDDEPEIGANYGVQGIPNLTFFHGGKPVEVSLGALPRQQLLKKIEQALASIAQPA